MIKVVKIEAKTLQSHPELIAEYAAESSNPTFGTPDPQWQMYALMESSGFMQALGVYEDGVLAGFSFVLNHILPHWGFKAATMESLFVSRKYDDTLCAGRLLLGVKKYAKEKGCKKLFYSAPAGGRLEKTLAKRHPCTNSIFCESLD